MDLKALKLTKRRQEILAKMGITDLEGILRHYPFRYEMVEAVPFQEWKVQDNVAFEGLICSPARVQWLGSKRSITHFSVMAWNEEIQVSLFNRPWPAQFQFGKPITIFGLYQGKNRVTASTYNFKHLPDQLGLHAVYSLPKECKVSDWTAILDKALPFVQTVDELVPERYVEKYRLLPRWQALNWIHKPSSSKELHQAIRTLKYEEFLCFQTAILAQGLTSIDKEPKMFDLSLIEEKVKSLPYSLTADQKKALEDVLEDMRSSQVMFRLIQGDVGCGKTVVAALSLYACFLSGMQAAFLAPTEILARQHMDNLKKLGIEARLLVSALPAAEKREILEGLENGEISIVVGTHALFQEKVKFENLGLVIADEQQRFGVRQRRSLLEKGNTVDFLAMSATPIPRTYAHFLFGDIALSSIHTMPPGRLPVKTEYIASSSMGPVLGRILAGIEEGRQVYVVCPAIEDNEETDLKAATKIYEGMKRTLKDKVRIELLHGKMSPEQKADIMDRFARHESDILVSTTVIEVGIDVPNATMMVIYDAHRFGLSTLHQLRGRTARGPRQGECFLLSSTKDPQAKERLKQLEVLLNGFEISEYDLKQRGPGDLLGTRQAGLPTFVLGDYEKDPAMMEAAVVDAREIVARGVDTELLEYARQASESARYMD